jgi:hypothetical protein
MGQDAAPPDRNVLNSRARPGNMMADSPVTFPKEGALPAKYPPDVREQSEPAEKDYYIFSSPCRSLAQIAEIQAAMPKGEFTPPPNDWTNLQRTRRILTQGGELRLLALGDSIVNDTMRSGWVAQLAAAYPKAAIHATVYVRGGGGCQHFKELDRIATNVIPRKPDLVFIGGISQRDIESIREVIHQLRAGLPEVEILLATGAFGTVDPRDPEALAKAPHSGTGAYGRALEELAAEQKCAYLDMTTPWAEYIRSAKVHPHLFYRDVVHANEYGEQILSKILMAFWTAPERDRKAFSPSGVRPPSALLADGADSKVFLEWNPNLEETLEGYHVYRAASNDKTFRRLTSAPVPDPAYVDRDSQNGAGARYHVTAVLREGKESAPSNEAEAVPSASQVPAVAEGVATVNMPGFEPVEVKHAVTVIFPNGQKLVFDKDQVKVRDWVTAGGTHLVYPLLYGNAVDLTELDDFGLPQPQPETDEHPAMPPPINLDYHKRDRQLAPLWVGWSTNGNRVIFEYRIPLSGPGIPQGTAHDVWIWATVWETWSAVNRNLSGSDYQGLVRKIELDVPSYYRDGYSVCLNDGFGVNGSCDGATTYELHWSDQGQTTLVETRWEKGKDTKGLGRPRGSSGFHPTAQAMQVSPFLFAHFPQGTLLIAPRHYYYSATYAWRDYAAQGKDGLWPNFAIDVALSGQRAPVESFEYLWNSSTNLAAPQLYMDASLHYRRNLADLYQLNRNLASLDYAWDYWGPGDRALAAKTRAESLEILKNWARETAEKASQAGADELGGAHELWFSSPYTISDSVRLDPNEPLSRAIAEVTRAFAAKGIRFGYWVRPEFVKQALPNVLSTHFFTTYGGYHRQFYPPAMSRIEKEGVPLIRQHPEWIRIGRSCKYPLRTPYNWTPMSLTAPGWYDQVVYPDLAMMKALGVSSVFQDGGFSDMAGVDYTGGHARPVQPYYWRYYQDMARLGLDLNGECPTGWASCNWGTPIPQDMKALWAMIGTTYRGNRDGSAFRWHTAEMRHKSHQLYVGCYLNLDGGPEHAKTARFGQRFLKEHGHPDRVFLENLRWDKTAGEWVWEKVWWEYVNGRRVRYPEFNELPGGSRSR